MSLATPSRAPSNDATSATPLLKRESFDVLDLPGWKMLVLSLVAAAAVFIIGSTLDWILLHEHEPKTVTVEISDALGGMVAGSLVFRLLQYERERRRRLRQRLEVIADMNHHIRNALQVISGTAYSAADQQQLEAVRQSVNRIQWTLREILPKL
jgi:signal transduction histidine kinase